MIAFLSPSKGITTNLNSTLLFTLEVKCWKGSLGSVPLLPVEEESVPLLPVEEEE